MRVRKAVELDGVMQRVEILNGRCADARLEHEVIAASDRGRRHSFYVPLACGLAQEGLIVYRETANQGSRKWFEVANARVHDRPRPRNIPAHPRRTITLRRLMDEHAIVLCKLA